MATSFLDASQVPQLGFSFPTPLTEKYAPKSLDEFVGLDKIKRAMSKIVAAPMPTNFFFLGPSGTGKTRMALTVASLMPAEVHHIASKECTIETVRDITRQCHFMPRMANDWTPCKMHCVICDESDQMSYAAQQAFLSILDGYSRTVECR
jgi:replication-associated recombination protein RarA